MRWFLLLAPMLLTVYAETIVYFQDYFDDGDDEWEKRWTMSKNKSDYGKFQLSAGKFYGDPEKDKGIQTIQDWKFYALSARFEPFSNEGQTLVIQYTVKHEQGIDCGGGYVKLFPADLNQTQMNRESQYYIMFGPDICGTIHEKLHVIFNYKGKNHLIKKDIKCKHDELTHLYTLILRPNNTYIVKIDNENVENGTLEDDWDFLQPKKIIDLNATKPLDWDEREKIEDPDDKRPDDWEETELIPDPEARKPNDWDSSMDGEWEAPVIPNPKYKGIWKPRIIDNPNYKGEWVRPDTDNPDYVPDPTIYKYDNIGVIGLDLWQVKSGTIFDNFLITNNETYAEIIGNLTWGLTKEPEMTMKQIQDEESDAKDERKQRWKRLEKEFERLEQMEKDGTLEQGGRHKIQEMIDRVTGKVKDEEKPKGIEEIKGMKEKSKERGGEQKEEGKREVIQEKKDGQKQEEEAKQYKGVKEEETEEEQERESGAEEEVKQTGVKEMEQEQEVEGKPEEEVKQETVQEKEDEGRREEAHEKVEEQTQKDKSQQTQLEEQENTKSVSKDEL
ncbi:calreticulin-like [Spea bombifrons]|uniref:calreticulin-like n=1 Tax=Spea bombifrons TaxID=233779 RepID=UPI00234BBDFB|nr:calreticulin-like [Spea bombifrons]